VRLKAPKNMGKTSLLLRVLDRASHQGYRTVSLNLEQIDREIFSNLRRFLRWLCAAVSHQLDITPQLDDYWDEDIGSKVSSTLYFRHYLLKQLDAPLLLAIDEVNQLFEYPQLAREVLPLFRSWYEEGKKVPSWQKLRLVVCHSTEIYLPLHLTQSPFNVGLPIKLPDFTPEQVQELAQRHGLDWQDGTQAQQLMELVGGHPYLVRLALYFLSQERISLPQLLAQAATPRGIYDEYLRRYLTALRQEPLLASAFQAVVAAEGGIPLDTELAYPLDRMGLIKFDSQGWKPLCELYRAYFATQLLAAETELDSYLEQLQRENQKLRKLVYLDELTQLANRRYFNELLETEWRRMAREGASLSLILLDIDRFKEYNDTYGHLQGDACLQAIARSLQECLNRPADRASRYGGEEFAIILPRTGGEGAVHLAETIRQAVKSRAIEHRRAQETGGIVTVSFGVASLQPILDSEPAVLVRQADIALYQSKEQGRDRVTLFQ
jgi:diguanylate cyclase (GGDEF)-like protein